MTLLTPADRIALSQRLDLMQQQVLDELRSEDPTRTVVAGSNDHEVASHADEAEAERAADVRFAEFDIDRARLDDIERARRRMAEGRYGICTDCSEAISRERLLAQPTAVRCTACQAASETLAHRAAPR